MPIKDKSRATPAFFFTVTNGAVSAKVEKDHNLITQGDPCDAVFYIEDGHAKVTVLAEQGKEAVIAILGPGDFCGEGCVGGQTVRMASVVAITECVVARLPKAAVFRLLHDNQDFSELFTAYLLSRNIRVEADLVDQLFNSSEKRLARLLLLLANFGKEGEPEPIIAPISQATLAEMIGTSRSRVSFFMNKFRKLGLIDYNGHVRVHRSLLNMVLHDDPKVQNLTSGSGQPA